MVANIQIDPYTTHAYSLAVLERFADVPVAQSFVAEWLVADAHAQEAGVQDFSYMESVVWRRLSPIALAKSMQTWGVTWSNVVEFCEQQPLSSFSWTREEGGKHLTYASQNNVLLTTQMNILSKLPHTVQNAEAMEALVDAGWCCTLATTLLLIPDFCR